jgi:HSP20 family molecular chaperone IbpA
MAKDLFRMSPDVCSYMSEDNNHLNIEVTMPGIDKKNIQLQMVDDSFSLSAAGKDVEYVTASAFCCPVKAAEAQATYENGCLKITIPFKDPFENAVQVAIS